MSKFLLGLGMYLFVALVLTLSFVGAVRADGRSAILWNMMNPDVGGQESTRQNRWNQYQQQQQIDLQEEQLDVQQQMLRIEQQRDRDANAYRYRMRNAPKIPAGGVYDDR